MSRRQSVDLPFAEARKQGQVVCVWRGGTLPSRRHRWCSTRCVLTYQIARGDQGAARKWLEYWDRGALHEPMPCEACGLDMSRRAINDRLAAEPEDQRRKLARADRHNWDADHRIPLAEGGTKTPDNLRVLCRPCHKAETAKLRARLAEARRSRA